MDISAVDGNRINEENKPVDREKVHFTGFALKAHDTVDRGTIKLNY